jgi:hypothetical protein
VRAEEAAPLKEVIHKQEGNSPQPYHFTGDPRKEKEDQSMPLKYAASAAAILGLCATLDPAPAAAQTVNCGDFYNRVLAAYRVAPLSAEYNQMAAAYVASCLAGRSSAAPAYPQYYSQAALPQIAPSANPAIPPGLARIWVYRDLDYVANGRPYVRFNGAAQGIAEKNAAWYRDVPPGPYLVTVDSQVPDVNQSSQFTLAAGQEAYIKIPSQVNEVGGGRRGGGTRDVFYAWLMRPDIGRAEVAQHSFDGGGPLMAALTPHP